MRTGFFFFILFFPPWGFSKVLISTVAQVKNHVVTSREVEIHNEVNSVLASEFQNLKTKKVLEEVVREWLLFFEASTFYNSNVGATEVEKLVNKAREKLKGSKKWTELGVSDRELRKKVARRLEADRLFDFKTKASILPVSMGEIESEYNQNRIRYGNQSFDQVKDKIRDNKIEENLKNRLEQWFVVLENKYKVQRFSRFSE